MICFRVRFFSAVLLLALGAFFTSCSTPPQGSNANVSNQNSNTSQQGNASSPGLEGFQDDVNCSGVIGWAWDSTRPDEPVKIEIYDGTTLLGTVAADLFRQDLLDARKGNGKHGFNFTFPPQLRDGKTHTIVTRIAGTDIDLTHSLKPIKCNPE